MKKFAAATLLLWAMPGFAAFDAFLKIDTLKPASSDAAHPGWVRISGFSWGANAPAGGQGCAANEAHFTLMTEDSGISYFFRHSDGKHQLIPEATIDFMGTRHDLQNVTVRVQGTTVLLHFARCLTHPPQVVRATGVVPNTTTRPQPPAVVSAGLVVPSTTPTPADTRMRFDTGAAQQFNLVGLRVTGLTASLKLRNESAAFFRTAAANRTKYTKVVMQKEALTFTFTNCVISSYSPGTDGVDTVGLSFSIYSGPPLGYP
jgi:hypothetical protein